MPRMYDGSSTGAAEAIMMAVRVTGRNARGDCADGASGVSRGDLGRMRRTRRFRRAEVEYASERTSRYGSARCGDYGVIRLVCLIQSPNFFGTIEDVAAIAELAHEQGCAADRFDCRGGLVWGS